MALQGKFNNLKAGPKEDKVAVASGVAVSVVVVLLAAWAIYFFHSIRGQQQVNLSGAADQFLPTSTTDAQKQLEQQFGLSAQDYQNIQQESADGNNSEMQTQQMEVQGSQSDQFGAGQ